MLYREIIAVCSQLHTKHINTVCGQNVHFHPTKRHATHNQLAVTNIQAPYCCSDPAPFPLQKLMYKLTQILPVITTFFSSKLLNFHFLVPYIPTHALRYAAFIRPRLQPEHQFRSNRHSKRSWCCFQYLSLQHINSRTRLTYRATRSYNKCLEIQSLLQTSLVV